MLGESMTDEYDEAKSEETRETLKVFRPIDKTEHYDPKSFVRAQSQIKDMEEYFQRLSQPNGQADVGAKRDLSELLYGGPNDQSNYEHLMSEANDAYSFAIENMSRYIENNRGQIINKFEGKSLLDLVLNKLPLYSTKEKKDGDHNGHYNEKHNKLVADILELRDMNSSDEKTVAKAQKNMMEKIMEDKEVPEWIKVSMQRYAGRESSFVPMIFSRYHAGQTKALFRYLTKGDKPDESKLRGLINNSLRVAYDDLDSVPSGKEHDKERREKIWENNLRECYKVMARELRSVEKEDLEEKDSKKREENERKAERISLRMAA
jgi:hypothetical protein